MAILRIETAPVAGDFEIANNMLYGNCMQYLLHEVVAFGVGDYEYFFIFMDSASAKATLFMS